MTWNNVHVTQLFDVLIRLERFVIYILYRNFINWSFSIKNIAIHNTDREHEEEVRQLRTDLATASAHCIELEEANRAWQKYQYDQMESFRQKLQEYIPSFDHIENSSLDSVAQQMINYLDQLNIQRDDLMRQIDTLTNEVQLQKRQLGKRSL
jgi:hypothetical protein